MPGVKILTFQKLAKPRAGETVVFSFIVYKSKAHRNKVNKKVMKEMKEFEKSEKAKGKKMEMPFDVKHMAYGGFKAIVKF